MREPIAAGDRFIFLTDGIYEAESAVGDSSDSSSPQHVPAVCAGDPRSDCRRLLDYVATIPPACPPPMIARC